MMFPATCTPIPEAVSEEEEAGEWAVAEDSDGEEVTVLDGAGELDMQPTRHLRIFQPNRNRNILPEKRNT